MNRHSVWFLFGTTESFNSQRSAAVAFGSINDSEQRA